MMGGGMGLLGFGGIGMVLFWILLIGVIVVVVSSVSANSATPHAQTPLEILQTRYAKGEISKEEYEETRSVL